MCFYDGFIQCEKCGKKFSEFDPEIKFIRCSNYSDNDTCNNCICMIGLCEFCLNREKEEIRNRRCFKEYNKINQILERLNFMNNIIPALKYFWITCKHKWFVLVVGLKLGVSVRRLLMHDMSKLTYKELHHYGRQFYGDKSRPEEFIKAWIHHQNHNEHHWEYWIPRTGHNRCEPPYPDNESVPIPEDVVLEMVADWIAATRAYEKKWPKLETWNWYNNKFNKIRVHKDTHVVIHNIIMKAQIDGIL